MNRYLRRILAAVPQTKSLTATGRFFRTQNRKDGDPMYDPKDPRVKESPDNLPDAEQTDEQQGGNDDG